MSRQQTLTQIDFVNLNGLADEDGEEDLDFYEKEEKFRRNKRRKTEGDAPISATKHYTQTLTQLDFVSTPLPKFDDLDDVEDLSAIYRRDRLSEIRGPGTDEMIDPQANFMKKMLRHSDQNEANNLVCVMAPPKTPKRTRLYEVLSSQSPTTPLSTHSRIRVEGRSPLKEKCPNFPSQRMSSNPSSLQRQVTKLPKLEIADTFDEEEDAGQQAVTLSSSPSKKGSASKSERVVQNYPYPGSPTSVVKTISRRPNESSPLKRVSKMEIEDSDAESDEEPQTCYDDPGFETQIEAAALVSSSEELQIVCSRSSTEACEKTSQDLPEATYQYSETQRLSTQDFDAMAPRSDRSDIIVSIHPQHVANIVNRRKDHEFRSWPIPDQVARIWVYETKPTSSLKYMASISAVKRPGEILELEGLGNTEFNAGKGARYAYQILQLYELANPVSLATAKANNWLGGPPQKYVYLRPAVLDHLMANLKPAMFTTALNTISLPASSLCGSSDSLDVEAQLHDTMLQFTQHTSPIVNTAHPSSSPIGSSDTKFNAALDLLSTQQDSYRHAQTETQPRPSQATTVDLTQPPSPPLKEQAITQEDGEAYQMDDLTIVPDSPLHSLPPNIPSSSPPLPNNPYLFTQETPMPFLASSPLLTRSQMLPSSLMNDSVPPPPEIIDDSDAEE